MPFLIPANNLRILGNHSFIRILSHPKASQRWPTGQRGFCKLESPSPRWKVKIDLFSFTYLDQVDFLVQVLSFHVTVFCYYQDRHKKPEMLSYYTDCMEYFMEYRIFSASAHHSHSCPFWPQFLLLFANFFPFFPGLMWLLQHFESIYHHHL